MKKHSYLQTLVLLLIAAVVVTACGGQPTATPTAPPPAVEPPTGGTVRGEAAVDAIDILILESFPVQVRVLARGNLPDGCTEIDGVGQERVDRTFTVTITTARPADAICTQALVPFEETIPLDARDLPAGVYSVDVNGVQGTFELQTDNSP